ncbi:MAG: hypothetical protein LDL41_02565 [Coleofasciculus sp. S288]|nr:hypothetical protein [Coleofasciculus sp. S288]
MNQQEKEFCFCTLALGNKYRLLAKELARDLEQYSPGTVLVVGTDSPKDFKACNNVLAFKLKQAGILHCYHDKRFVIDKALSRFRVAIQIDADTRIVDNVPDPIEWLPGITAGHLENLVEHVETYTPERLESLKEIALKLNIPLEKTTYVGESLFFVSRDGGKEKEFIKHWDTIARYLELKGIHSGEGNAIGMAAAKAGLKIGNSSGWETLNKIKRHMDASYEKKPKKFWHSFQRRLGYHYRLQRTRIAALTNFDFYYR